MKTSLLLLFLLTISISCEIKSGQVENKESDTIKKIFLNELPVCHIDTFIDSRDQNRYSIITIGKQTWTRGIIQFKPNKGRIFHGNLYNWDAAVESCPKTFRIPSDSDWDELFHYVYDSIIKKASPKLIEKLASNSQEIHCNECKNKFNARVPNKFRLDLEIKKMDSYNFLKIKENHDNQMTIMFLLLERMGFCTYGSGFKYNGGLGVDDYSYFWSSTTDKSGSHKYISIYTGNYCQGCGYRFGMPFNNNNGYNLKCVKTN